MHIIIEAVALAKVDYLLLIDVTGDVCFGPYDLVFMEEKMYGHLELRANTIKYMREQDDFKEFAKNDVEECSSYNIYLNKYHMISTQIDIT